MNRLIAFMGAWFTLASGIAHALPARPLYVPEPPLKAPSEFFLDIRGTSWVGQDFVPNYQMTFKADGTLSYGYKGKLNHGGSWIQQGNSVYFEINKKYREFKGSVDADTLQGESWNVTGKRWQTHLRRASTSP